MSGAKPAARGRNPYDLARRGGGPAAPAAARVWTPEEIAEKLKGYLEVPPAYWELVRAGTHMRYFTKAEGFRPGGFVEQNPVGRAAKDADAGAELKKVMRLRNGFNDKAPGYASWAVAYDDLDKVFVKLEAGALALLQILESAITKLNENIRRIAEHSKQLERRLTKLEQG